jgi:hypothetical protein
MSTVTFKDITDEMVIEYLRELNTHITRTELAVAFNIVNKHLNHNVPTDNPMAPTHPSQLPVEQDPFFG